MNDQNDKQPQKVKTENKYEEFNLMLLKNQNALPLFFFFFLNLLLHFAIFF